MSGNALRSIIVAAIASALVSSPVICQQLTPDIPLPEHPRPDFHRAEWRNLNGDWRFRLDPGDRGAAAGWQRAPLASPRSITVPFPWGSALSGIPDSADIGWYERTIEIPAAWRGKRVFLVVGASDWRTSAWLDGVKLGDHQGGYTPFSFELTPRATLGVPHRLTLRVDDRDHPFKLEGKQGYGKARGIWQTVYLEARGSAPLESVHLIPDVDQGMVTVAARLRERAPADLDVRLTFTNRDGTAPATARIPRGGDSVRFDVPLPNARLWSLEDPFLHEVTATVTGPGLAEDRVDTYFGMRKISVVDLPGTTIPYVALNGKPVYLQLALDQAYHPEGFYTFPSDEFMRDEILRSRQIGLNGQRVHIKVEVPRKLYWADRLGVLIMADVPNWWGPPDSAAFAEHEAAMRGMIQRDFNHPSIFSWIPFNETWGLVTKVGEREQYLPETKRKVVSVYRLAKALDPTRLVEDNSVCCNRGHTETDLNTWHAYLAGWEWEGLMRTISDSTVPGSPWNFEDGWTQGRQPMLNSEFGNVWGYQGSTGDVDYSWDYHMAIDAFRRHPKLAGWLYTEHHDVINEWNGYWRYDRSSKETGLGDLVEGMSLRDLHAPWYIAMGPDMSRAVRPGETVQVPLWASIMADARGLGDSLTIRTELYGWNTLGERSSWSTASRRIAVRPWMSHALAPLSVRMPTEPAVAVLALRLEDAAGTVLHRNFTTFIVEGTVPIDMRLANGRRARVARVAAGSYTDARWSQKTWTVLDRLKVNGAGAGFFEYRIPWPRDVAASAVEAATFLVEASAKQLLGKDRDSTARQQGDYMRGGGFVDPGKNPNAYPMTDETRFPSAVTVMVNGEHAGRYELEDDPADHRGILSWHSQKRDKRLHEAGSYGQLLRVAIPPEALAKAATAGEVVVRLSVDEALPGGLAIYGAQFGRYPVDPSVVLVLREGTGGR